MGATLATFPILRALALHQAAPRPVLEDTGNGTYTKKYTVHKIGTSCLKTTGQPLLGEEIPIGERDNILILAYAYSTTAGF